MTCSLLFSPLLNSFPQPHTPTSHRYLLDTKEMVRAARVTATDIANAETATVAMPMTIGAETTAAGEGEGEGTKTTTTVTTTATTTTATGPATTTTQPSTTTTIVTGSEITTVSETTTSTLTTVGEEQVGVGEDWMEGDAAGALDENTTVPKIGQGERRHLYTVEPLNKGHYGANNCREVVPISEVKQYTKVLAWG